MRSVTTLASGVASRHARGSSPVDFSGAAWRAGGNKEEEDRNGGQGRTRGGRSE